MKVVVSLGEDPKHRGLVRPLVEQLERRMRLLVERDYRSAVASLEGRCQEVGDGGAGDGSRLRSHETSD